MFTTMGERFTMTGDVEADRRNLGLDLDRSDHPAARLLDQLLERVRQLAPSQATKAFEATVDLEKVGAAEVDGVATTRYHVTVDTREALRAMNMGGLVPPERLPRTMRYDVWVGGDDLLRRLRATVLGATVDVRFSQWGEPVDISAPPARMTTPMPGTAHLREPATARG